MKKILKYIFLGGILLGFGLLINAYRQHAMPSFNVRKIRKAKREFENRTIHKHRKHVSIIAYDFGLKNKKRVVAACLMLLIAGITSETVLKPYGFFLKTSLLNIETTPFTGTVSPVEFVPNWVKLTSAERKLPFNQIPKSKIMPLPEYDINAIQKGFRSAWNENQKERNQYITYSVLYMGDYKLQANVGNGSHIGVDIKLPYNTPLRSIADGTVYKVERTEVGFGNYVTIAHTNAPDPKKPGKTTTLLSTYAHMGRINVQEGSIVRKGQTIGMSGNSGNSTAPHLHFQIETIDAPFHPYWPFTYNDTKSAGISYYDAVNTGLGRSKGYQYTIDPFLFVNNNKDFQFVVEKETPAKNLVASTKEVSVQKPVETIVEKDNSKNTLQEIDHEIEYPDSNKAFEAELKENTQKLAYHNAQKAAENKNKSNTAFNRAMMEEALIFETDNSFIPGEEEIIALTIADEKLIATNGILINSTLKHLAEIHPTRLKQKDFNNGVAKIRVITDSDSSFRLIASGDFGQIKSKSLRASVFQDIPKDHEYAESIKYLKDNQIVKGYSDGTFRPENKINRAEAVKILLEGNSILAKETLNNFPDVAPNAWFNNYVSTAYKEGIIKGYADGSFQPAKDISRAEFTKIALETAGIPTPENALDTYADVNKSDWFAKYMAVAKRYYFFETYGGGNVEPSKSITRGEAAYIMYKIEELN